jgi:hypothetical protein
MNMSRELEGQGDMDNEPAQTRAYTKPRLVMYGSLADLTQKNSLKAFNEMNGGMTRSTEIDASPLLGPFGDEF